MPPTSPTSRISLSVPGLPHELNVLKFDGHEAISQPYRFVIDVVSREADLTAEPFLHQPAFLAFDDQNNGKQTSVCRTVPFQESDGNGFTVVCT